MNFLADECTSTQVVRSLREDGHDVLYAAEALQGSTDREVLAEAFSSNRVLLTEDKDFGELVFRLGHRSVGIILLRFPEQEPDEKVHRLRTFLAQSEEKIQGSFVVLEPDKTRIRPL